MATRAHPRPEPAAPELLDLARLLARALVEDDDAAATRSHQEERRHG